MGVRLLYSVENVVEFGLKIIFGDSLYNVELAGAIPHIRVAGYR